jgi:hypothetical protein
MAKNIIDIGSDDLYRAYLKSLDTVEESSGFVVKKHVLNGAVAELNRALAEEMILHNRFMELPYNLGRIAVMKNLPSPKRKASGRLNLAIDYKATNDLWKEDPIAKENKRYVYHRNIHSGGYVFKFKWLKGAARTHNIWGYKFVPVKQLKRDLARILKDPLIRVDFFEG